MLNVCMYEFEDIVCNDLYQCDDHVVPCAEHDSFQCNSHKSLHHGARCIESSAEELPCVHQISLQKAEQSNSTMIRQRSNVLEKETWLKKSCSGLPLGSSESIDEEASLVSDGTKTSNHSFMSNIQSSRSECVNDSIPSDKSPKVSNTFDYRRDHISEADNDHSFFGNNQDEKTVNDLLHYSWADIGNFDDVDRMFRSYDSTFGQGISHDDNLSWFSLSNATQESGDTFKLDSKFSCPDSSSLRNTVQENDDMSRFDGISCSINESDMQSSSIMYRGSSRSSVRGESGHFGPLSFSNGSGCSGDKDNNDYFMPNAQMNEQNTQLKHQNQADINENVQYLEDSPIFYAENAAESGKHQPDSLESQSFGYLQCSTPYMSSEYNGQPDQYSLRPPQSVIKSENSIPTSFSLENSSSLNQMQSTDLNQSSLQEISFSSEKRVQIYQQRGLQTSVSVKPENVDMAVQASICGMTPEKAVPYSAENHIGGEGDVGVSFDLGSSAHYSSMSSGLNDISLEATSFRQLQNAMEQLDLRTKLCIRDSLYRLARSAEQRHVNMNGGSIDETDSMSAEQRNKFTGFMGIETETNPIDRSIAHLLFHRPPDSSVLAVGHDSSFKSPAPIHWSSNNSPLIADDSIKREETEAKSERNGRNVVDN